ncbi:MAG TPA: M1 family aminopeptidase, partial [Cytophagaceae bacterium]
APYAKNIFGNTPEMINFFSDILNYKYPWSKYSQIVVRDYVSGAMENTTATIFMEALQVDDRELLDKNWDGIIAHELFHHWFGDLVTSESWSNLPLNESFANYSEYLWAEHKYGVDEADYLGEKEKEEYYAEAATKQEPLIRYHYKDREDMFDRHSYNKGGRVLHMLRKLVGDEAFFSALNHYLKKNEYTSVEIHDLRLALEDVTGEDYNWFFNQWFLSPGHPELQVSHSYVSGVLRLKISQIHDTTYTPVYRIPLKVEVWANGEKKIHNVTLDKANQEFMLPVPYMPQMVNIDADNSLLAIVNHKKSKDELIFQYNNSERYLLRYAALKELFAPIPNATEKPTSAFGEAKTRDLLAKALEDKFWVIRELALSQFSQYAIPEVQSYMKKIEQIALADTKPETRARAIYLLSSFDNKAYKHVYEKGLNEKPYSIVGASLSSYLKTQPSDAPKVAQEYEKYDNLNILLALGDYYTDVKDKSKYPWFKENMNTGDGQKLYNFMNAFGQYLMVIDGPEKEDGKKILEKIAAENKHEVIRETAKAYLQYVK